MGRLPDKGTWRAEPLTPPNNLPQRPGLIKNTAPFFCWGAEALSPEDKAVRMSVSLRVQDVLPHAQAQLTGRGTTAPQVAGSPAGRGGKSYEISARADATSAF